MSYSHAAVAYRERQVKTASPGQLVVMVFDHVLASLARARVANKDGNVEARVEAVAKAREGLMELMVTLDLERGGAIAQQLRSLYVFMLAELVDAGSRFNEPKTLRIAAMIGELRDAFATIVAESGPRTSAA
jgi:flagellar protein FliS